ncbi:MAG: hypothetical protein M9895_04385 [Aquamicrobium sp.]|uniref:hypothetical protein n=1 Tax=Aquamicrobium sp. TaxID=1872579 RepID=UPI00349EE098|nr:hypothetical protein [Aquamicrobium sp.]MCO5157949.1 hypothetical protein [Aquamicrobium sp.]
MSDDGRTITVQFVVTLSLKATEDFFDHELRDALTPDVEMANAMLAEAGLAVEVIDISSQEVFSA